MVSGIIFASIVLLLLVLAIFLIFKRVDSEKSYTYQPVVPPKYKTLTQSPNQKSDLTPDYTTGLIVGAMMASSFNESSSDTSAASSDSCCGSDCACGAD